MYGDPGTRVPGYPDTRFGLIRRRSNAIKMEQIVYGNPGTRVPGCKFWGRGATTLSRLGRGATLDGTALGREKSEDGTVK